MNVDQLKELDLSYPRPLARRKSFIPLNGKWDFLLEDSDVGEREPRQKEFPENHLTITVPFCYQSQLSGVNIQKRYDTVWYQKDVTFDVKENERVILHFDASDYITWVYVNSQLVGKHVGGYTSFEFDITNYLKDGKAHIAVRCDDSYDLHQPRGKQKWKENNFGCWYQEVTGIWKSVWAEIVPDTYIKKFKLTANKNNSIDVDIFLNNGVFDGKIAVNVGFLGKNVAKAEVASSGEACSINIPLSEVHYWDLDDPNLYDISLSLSSGDEVKTQFGYRFIETKNGQVLLNDKPLFMRLTLEQGYFPEGIYTFKDEEELINEIKIIKESGFNGLRMHQKVEDDRFYYLCDVLGLIVWSEMPSCYDFDENTRLNTIREWKEVLWQHYNHPSILVWTPCNESWGVPGIRHNKEQHDFLVELYFITKEFDKTRLVVSNDGWEHCVTDIVTLHNYIQDPAEFKKYFVDDVLNILKENKVIDIHSTFVPFADGYKYEGQPIMVDEFCGIGFNIDRVNDGWGYGDQVKDIEEFLNRYRGLVEAATNCPHFAGWCMTQITDVYQEINGLYTIDRKAKFPVDKICAINKYNKK